MNISVIVILFKSRINESSTIKSLLETDLQDIKLNIIIWNNGPELLCKSSVETFMNVCNEKNIHFQIYEDIRNISLSRIYNFFIKKTDYDFFTILDQDSSLQCDFFSNIIKYSSYDLILPKVYDINSKSVQTHPNTDDNRLIESGIVSINNVKSIGSGITLSKQLLLKLNNNSYQPFDENYVLYNCDFRFFFRLRKIKTFPISVYCSGYIIHSESAYFGCDKMPEINKLELGYSHLLYRIFEKRKSTLNNIFWCFKYTRRLRCSLDSLKKLLVSTFFKEHPRRNFFIDPSIKPSYEN